MKKYTRRLLSTAVIAMSIAAIPVSLACTRAVFLGENERVLPGPSMASKVAVGQCRYKFMGDATRVETAWWRRP